MENITIVTEGFYDGNILEKILKNKLHNFNLVKSQGYSSALSKARSLLAFGKKVVLVLDSNSTNNSERKGFIRSYLPINNSSQFKLILIEPEFEAIFIENKSFMKKYLPVNYNQDILVYAKIAPKRFIEDTLKIRREDLVRKIENVEILNDFYENKYIKEIIKFSKLQRLINN